MRAMDTQVLIVGGGPVGLTLAVDLGKRGVRTMLIEQKEAPQFLPKMERCNARTLEIFRRMGIADRVRAAGLPAHVPMDVFIVLSLTRPPLLHLPYPSVEEARAQIRACSDGSLPLEPCHRRASSWRSHSSWARMNSTRARLTSALTWWPKALANS